MSDDQTRERKGKKSEIEAISGYVSMCNCKCLHFHIVMCSSFLCVLSLTATGGKVNNFIWARTWNNDISHRAAFHNMLPLLSLRKWLCTMHDRERCDELRYWNKWLPSYHEHYAHHKLSSLLTQRGDYTFNKTLFTLDVIITRDAMMFLDTSVTRCR